MILKSPESVLWNAVISDASVTSMIGYRIYPQLAPAVDALPFMTWRRTSITREQTLGLPMGVPRVSVDFIVFAETYVTARKVADAVRSVLDGYGGSFDNTQVRQCSLESESDDVVSLEGSEVPNAYAVTQTYDVWWQEI
jgi:hypothetical protein